MAGRQTLAVHFREVPVERKLTVLSRGVLKVEVMIEKCIKTMIL